MSLDHRDMLSQKCGVNPIDTHMMSHGAMLNDYTLSTAKSIINFQVVAAKLRFDVNAAVAKQLGVTNSSRLLRLARVYLRSSF